MGIKDDSGFTLLEVVVILTLISVMMLMTVPRIVRSARSADENGKIFRSTIERTVSDSIINAKNNFIVFHAEKEGERIKDFTGRKNGISVLNFDGNVFTESPLPALSYKQFPDSFMIESVIAGRGKVLDSGDIIVSVYPDGKTETLVIRIRNNDKTVNYRLSNGEITQLNDENTENAYLSK
ncbi:MAG TPA: prepilin-type N-terminal cleavage/methylation domain-containing protein [Spirochaetota bacterium]|nr:prepilin-type N-terminal cleavage/methylation domain-containing protein [Spirochaetota bacterium]HPJ15578.1 prepilin-type N-terminal cleavage/methylation domain-containing protein [Spirochaetota bacterium]HPM34374.1 prepilin-type N-terminal cleavage/methylation domain-containing protein [Spirochaetota bacterium]HPW52580.1 prepilin-type N-terminal cleavage/methylation domain-containing protein [Spirochaetota bacterium]